MSIWRPTKCELQLTFTHPAQHSTDLVSDEYSGVSTITYRKCEYTGMPAATDDAAEGGTEFSSFQKHQHLVAQESALHFHAYTAPVKGATPFLPMTIESYKVLRNGKPLKVLRVVEEHTSENESKASNERPDKGKKHKEKTNVKNKKTSSTTQDEAQVSGAQSTMQQRHEPVDFGSKMLYFAEGDTLATGTAVELVISFRARLQSWERGGIYRPQHGGALLTHFEVSVARYAFPCPDSPQYRLEWQWRTLTFPDIFDDVFATGDMVGKRNMGTQRLIQYSFAAMGPAPAYTFAFCALPNTATAALRVDRTVKLCPSALQAHAKSECSPAEEEEEETPFSVVARGAGGVTQDMLEMVMRTAEEALRLLTDFFAAPLPLLQCSSLCILLAPTMPFIAGMEHHGCIFLNEAIYATERHASSASGAPPATEQERVQLVVHELAHHWVGNAIGLPFAVKEGVCQVLEQYLGNVILGKAQKMEGVKGKATARGGVASAPALHSNNSEILPSVSETEKGREFTVASYHEAEVAIKNWIASHGFAAFQKGMRALIRDKFTTLQDQLDNGLVDDSDIANRPGGVYLCTTEFMTYLETNGE